MSDPEDKSASGAQTVRRALALLRLIACGQERGVRLVDLERMSGLNRPTVHRLLKTLVQEEAVEQDPETRRYLIGQEITLLGLARTRRFPLLTLADPYMAELADQVGDTVFLSIRHGHDSICIGRRTGRHPIQVLSIEVGVRRPLGVGVSGVALLASLDAEESVRLVRSNAARLEGERVEDVIARVEVARRDGLAHAPAGLMPGTSAVAVPIMSARGEALGAITVTAMAERLGVERFEGVVERMRAAAGGIAGRWGQVSSRG
ncbi:IclR family transcriptional regulator [Achromobacter sp. NFACC18-2]|uniref:IclR family transcriptional regulator n=1 Tax=Achromobacter sp. NFACC18-2 TaxID=1564112 RepID=UPI0008BF53CE|nr:IclR family transcriptional regulator [Achromobacter sp. NFACC18-2]SEJ11271.1 transcriptional regulator, IclR family [Achromobacter sp. NFACC18-2]